MTKTPYERLIEYFGSPSKAALALDVSKQAVDWWRSNGIPKTRAYQIEIKTNNEIKASDILGNVA